MGTEPDPNSNDALRSWKEVAGFLAVTERTAQRWEKTAGLPVHRMGGGARARIVVYPDELRKWMASCGPALEAEPPREQRAPERRSWQWVVAAAGLGAIGVLLAALGLRAAVSPGAPKAWSLHGSRFTVADERDRVCWEKWFPQLNKLHDTARHETALIADIDGDRQQEVLFNLFPQDLPKLRSTLYCYDEKGRLRWEHRYGGPRSFGGRTFEPAFAAHFFRPVSVHGRRYVVVVANHYIWYPSQVSLLDARTGELVEEYWHPGLIERFILHDIDNDGEEEVLFTAINNPGEGLGHMALGALKLPFSKAPRRTGGSEARFPPPTGGGELAYVLFPHADMNRALARLPESADLRIAGRDRILVEAKLPENGGIVYYLDFGFRLVETRFSDNFAPLHERLFRQRILDHRLSPEERAVLGRVARFDAAPDGNSPDVARFWSR